MRYTLYIIIALLLSSVVIPDATAAKKRKPAKKKAKVTAVATPTVAVLPVDSLLGKAYAGKIGQTVVDFFGNRNVYGDVVQDMLITADPNAEMQHYVVIRQLNGVEELYIIEPLNYTDGIIKVGEHSYHTLADGTLSLQPMTQNSEERKGVLTQTSAGGIMRMAYNHGKHLSGMSIQTDEDKRNARLLLGVASDNNIDDAREYFVTYNTRLAEKGDQKAIRCLFHIAMNAKNHDDAHKYIDSLIALDASKPELMADKGTIYLQQGKTSDAKKIWKKLKKNAADFVNTSEHPFCKAMR